MKAATTDHRVTTRIVAGVAVVGLIVHLLTIHRYGYFRDELYYIACARHLDFGYVDLAPLSAFLLRIELILFGSSLFALRIFPALACSHASSVAASRGSRSPARACSEVCFFSRSAIFIHRMFYEPLFWTARSTCSAELLTARRLGPGFGWVQLPGSESKTSTQWSFSAWQPRLRFC